MVKRNLTVAVLIFSSVFLTGCGSADNPNKALNNNPVIPKVAVGDVGDNMCEYITADFVYSATGKTVVKVEPDWFQSLAACRYYFTYDPNYNTQFDDPRFRGGGQLIFMMIENLSVENQKKGLEILSAAYKTEPSIKMENMATYRKDGSLRDLRLIINPNRYVRIETNNGKAGITESELINFAIKVAEKIQGNLSFSIKNNPIDLEQEKRVALGESQQEVVYSFMNKLTDLKIDDALKMMDVNESTKKMWSINFNTIEKLKVKNLEEVFKEEWTPTRQSFKVELEVKVKLAGEQLGWQNGTNYRWITLQKNNQGEWFIHEIANNP